MVLRQIPFTTDGFVTTGSYAVTRFMNLPRWNISPSLAFSFDLGKDEVARINFVQYYGKSVNGPAGYDISDETINNYLYDSDDVQRNGLRPYVVTSEFDRTPTNGTQGSFRAPGWAKIVGDALIGGHLKMSGTINFVGIPEPIAVGDNLEFDGVVYHIEQIMHTAAISPEGSKIFRTTVTVSNGMDIQNGQNVVYSEMAYSSGYAKRNADYQHNHVLPRVLKMPLWHSTVRIAILESRLVSLFNPMLPTIPVTRTGLCTEYDVITFEQFENKGSTSTTYKNCLSTQGFGGLADYFEYTLRAKTFQTNKGPPTFGDQDGAVVLIQCLDGIGDRAIVTGTLIHPDRTTNITSTAPQLSGEYNGVNVEIANDGSCSLTFKGPPTVRAFPTDSSQGNTVMQIETDGSFQFNHSTITIRADKNGTLSITTNVDCDHYSFWRS
ncbi:unnamed protein product [Sphagnum balticum]